MWDYILPTLFRYNGIDDNFWYYDFHGYNPIGLYYFLGRSGSHRFCLGRDRTEHLALKEKAQS